MDISFYQLLTTPLERAVPRLLDKVYASGLRVLIVCESAQQLETLNSTLWTFTPTAFLPHGRDGDPLDHPIWLSLEAVNSNKADVLLVANGHNLTEDMGFSRYLDFFDGNDPEAVLSARGRYKKYKEAGHTLAFWKQNDAGGWDKI